MHKKNFARVIAIICLVGGTLLSGCAKEKTISTETETQQLLDVTNKLSVFEQDKPQINPTKTTSSISKDANPQVAKQRIPVLYYHSIDIEVGNELRIPPDEFDAQMNYLYDAGFQSITLNHLHKHYTEGLELPPKPFLMTFDDGYEDNYTNAFPIAKKYGFTGSTFMVTEWIDHSGYLSTAQIKEMSTKGWEIESHTATHPKLDEVSAQPLKKEMLDSKRLLEQILDRSVKYIVYPYGNYNDQVIDAAREAGYVMGFTTERGWANPQNLYTLNRVYCYADMSLGEFKRRVEKPNY